ncbi:MAG: Rne/Rng family ribonuclease [Terriglobales bacterium]
MNKELYVSSTPHETRVAVAEDGEIAEVYYEREKEYSLAGAIYKGRVTRVLPGMQSAFVDLGLERDAFLYVSDFFEDSEEYDRVVSEAEIAAAGLERQAEGSPAALAEVPASRVMPAEAAPASEAMPAEAAPAAPAAAAGDVLPPEEPRGRRGRHRGRRGRGGAAIPEEKFARPEPGASASASAPEAKRDAAGEEPGARARAAALVLPGESMAKYRESAPAPPAVTASAPPRAAVPPPAAPALVLPGESLAKYREAAPEPAPLSEPESALPALAEAEADGGEELSSEQVREDFEREQMQPDSPAAAAAEEVEWATAEGAEEGTGAESEAGEASASVRAAGDQVHRQAPREDGSEAGRGGRRHRRRRRGGEHASEAAPAAAEPPVREGKNESARLIGDLLHEGQEILIQIAKEPLGKKGARITSHLALPGRYLVYMPTVHHIGVSRRIASDEERARLKRILLENTQNLPGGFIVRTAGAGAREDELLADIRLLANEWNDLRQQFEQVRAPALLHHDLNLVERILRDQLSNDFIHIWVDSEEQYQRVVKFVDFFMPHLVDRVRLYTREEPMFEHFGAQEEINKALHSKVWLKSGGYIVLNQTEALVAIDVNTGKYVGKSNRLEDTIVKTNIEAIREIARQIRLRDLGGIIVIDFIDMDERRNRQKVLQALEEAMRADRAPSKILGFNDFGLVALTRKRVKQSLERALGSPCPYCEGVGLVKSPVTVCNEIYLEIKRLAPSIEREDVVLRVNPEVAKVLKAQSAQRLREMEELVKKGISVRPDPQVHQERFEIY